MSKLVVQDNTSQEDQELNDLILKVVRGAKKENSNETYSMEDIYKVVGLNEFKSPQNDVRNAKNELRSAMRKLRTDLKLIEAEEDKSRGTKTKEGLKRAGTLTGIAVGKFCLAVVSICTVAVGVAVTMVGVPGKEINKVTNAIGRFTRLGNVLGSVSRLGEGITTIGKIGMENAGLVPQGITEKGKKAAGDKLGLEGDAQDWERAVRIGAKQYAQWSPPKPTPDVIGKTAGVMTAIKKNKRGGMEMN